MSAAFFELVEAARSLEKVADRYHVAALLQKGSLAVLASTAERNGWDDKLSKSIEAHRESIERMQNRLAQDELMAAVDRLGKAHVAAALAAAELLAAPIYIDKPAENTDHAA